MKVIQENQVQDEITRLKNFTDTALKNYKALHKRERNIKAMKMCEMYSEAFLNLYDLRMHNIDFLNDSLYLQLEAIRDNFWKFMR